MGKWFPSNGWHTTAPHVDPADRRRLDLVIYGATPLGGALCCDATSVSPLTRTGQPQPCAAAMDGAAHRMAARRVPAAQHGRRAAAGGLGTGITAQRPARPPHCCQGEGGGPNWQFQCSGPSLRMSRLTSRTTTATITTTQHWATRGWCRLAPTRSMAPSSTRFSTWPSRRDPAACRCGRRPPTKTQAADAKRSEKKSNNLCKIQVVFPHKITGFFQQNPPQIRPRCIGLHGFSPDE